MPPCPFITHYQTRSTTQTQQTKPNGLNYFDVINCKSLSHVRRYCQSLLPCTRCISSPLLPPSFASLVPFFSKAHQCNALLHEMKALSLSCSPFSRALLSSDAPASTLTSTCTFRDKCCDMDHSVRASACPTLCHGMKSKAHPARKKL